MTNIYDKIKEALERIEQIPEPKMDEALKQKIYDDARNNPNNMSNWLPKILESKTRNHSFLRVPKTHIFEIYDDWWEWLRSDNYTDEKIELFNIYLNGFLYRYFGDNQTVFMKTGVFSNKFNFVEPLITDRSQVGKNFLNMYYYSMLVGAHTTKEVVFREYIPNKDNHETIYNGMPLHTEFRVFYDFDEHKVVGVANYWHPDVMEHGINSPEDKETYNKSKERIIKEYDENKGYIQSEVHEFMKGCETLTGKWSVDVMLVSDDDPWLIDMARMENSALVDKIEYVEELE